MRESIFLASIRYFFVGLAVILGVSLGLTLIILLFSSIETEDGDLDITYTWTPEVMPNAKNVRKILSSSAPVILKININGIIGTELLSTQTIESQLVESRERALKDGRVKAILLDINSPGGTVVDANGIYKAIKAYKDLYKVPVYAYVDGLCASGAFYIAASADKIYTSDVSIIGSVGVIVPTIFNFSKLMDKVGLESVTLLAGKGKDELNPFRPWKPDEQKNYQDLINHYYSHFVEIVTSNRPGVSREKLVQDYGAQVFPASLAQDYGYIDESGVSYNEALKRLLKQLSIDDDFYQVVELQKQTWLTTLFKSEENVSLLKGVVKHKIELTPELDSKLMGQFLYLYRPE